MDLTFTEEQQLLRQSAERYLQQRYGFAERQRYAADSKGWDSKVWSDFAQFGWLALPFEVDNGGLGNRRDRACAAGKGIWQRTGRRAVFAVDRPVRVSA